MSDVGQQMLLELRRIRELLEANQPLGFGKKQARTYIFIRHSPESLWYTRDKLEQVNIAISERDLTGYLRNVWRYDRPDKSTEEVVPKLMVEIDADRPYVIQTGIDTNFTKSLLAALLELEPKDLKVPVTLVVEDNAGGRGRPTVFARLEVRGQRVKPTFNKRIVAHELLAEVQKRFGFVSPFNSAGS